jgi:SAM-dependent methyltransferase
MTYTERDRAESFGEDAELYERARPGYPPELIAELAGGERLDVLDVGCGTGKAARAFAALGCSVLGVEIDPRMAAVARASGIEVEVGSFEGWDAAGRRFDLVASGQAWHWVDPAVAPARAATLLRDGGRLTPFWNHRDALADAGEAAAVTEVYRREAPGLVPESGVVGLHDHEADIAGHMAAIDASGCFLPCQLERYRWSDRFPTQRWLDRLATNSEHRRLDPAARARLFEGLRALYEGRGGEVRISYTTFCIVARRA